MKTFSREIEETKRMQCYAGESNTNMTSNDAQYAVEMISLLQHSRTYC